MAPMCNVSPQPIWLACDPANQLESEAVQCIDDSTRYLETRGGRRARWRRAFTFARVWRKVPMMASMLLLFLLLGFGAQMLATARHDRLACEAEYDDCMAEQEALALAGAVLDQSSLAPCESLVQVRSLSDGPDLACDMATSRSVFGMAAWRWLLFLGLFWPTQIAAMVLVKAGALLIQGYCKASGQIAGLYTHGLEGAFANTVRAASWVGIWFALAHKPLEWSRDAVNWNDEAADTVWPTVFTDVHSVTWRILVLWAMVAAARALVKVAGRLLAIRFHYSGHDSEASVQHERLLRALIAPRNVPKYADVRLRGRSGKPTRISGMACVWWTALQLLDTISAAGKGHVSGRARHVCDRLCAYFARRHGVDTEGVCSSVREHIERQSRTSEETMCMSFAVGNNDRCSATCSDPAEDPKLSAKRMAALIFLNMQPSASPRDTPKMTLTREDELPDEAWELLPGESKMTMGGLALCLMHVQRDSARLHKVLYSHSRVVGEVECALGAVLLGAIAFSSVALFNPASFVKVWTGLSVIMVALCFVFGNSVRQLYESIVFLFWTRPFNVGDILHVDNIQVVVTEIYLRYVRVTRNNGLNTVVPMSEIPGSHIVNESRSTSIWGTVEFDCDTQITLAQCDMVAEHVKLAIADHPDVLAGDYCVNLVPSEANAQKIMLRVSFARLPVSAHELMKDEGQTYIVDAVCSGMGSAGIKYTTQLKV